MPGATLGQRRCESNGIARFAQIFHKRAPAVQPVTHKGAARVVDSALIAIYTGRASVGRSKNVHNNAGPTTHIEHPLSTLWGAESANHALLLRVPEPLHHKAPRSRSVLVVPGRSRWRPRCGALTGSVEHAYLYFPVTHVDAVGGAARRKEAPC